MKSQFINSALLFVLSASLIYSCKSEKQNSHELLDTATFYMQVSGNLMGKSTDEQDFISVINSELQALKNDSNAKVDVNPLNIELKEAVAYCQDRIKSINASKEVDPAIGLKAKTLKHFELYLDILRQEMSTALGIMASNSTINI